MNRSGLYTADWEKKKKYTARRDVQPNKNQKAAQACTHLCTSLRERAGHTSRAQTPVYHTHSTSPSPLAPFPIALVPYCSRRFVRRGGVADPVLLRLLADPDVDDRTVPS